MTDFSVNISRTIEGLYERGVGENGEGIKLDPPLTPCAKITSNVLKNLNIYIKAINNLEDNNGH